MLMVVSFAPPGQWPRRFSPSVLVLVEVRPEASKELAGLTSDATISDGRFDSFMMKPSVGDFFLRCSATSVQVIA